MEQNSKLRKSSRFPTKLVQRGEIRFWFSKTTELPILPSKCFVGLRQNVTMLRVAGAVLNDVFPGLHGDVRGTLTAVRLVEFHTLVVSTDVAVTGQCLGTAGPQLA